MADDWSWPYAGVLGDPVVKTPAFDRVAREGSCSQNAFVSAPSCTPSRLAVATGRGTGGFRTARTSAARSARVCRCIRSCCSGRLPDRLRPQGRGTERLRIHRRAIRSGRGSRRSRSSSPTPGRRAVLFLVRRRRTASPVSSWRRRQAGTGPCAGEAARLLARPRNHAAGTSPTIFTGSNDTTPTARMLALLETVGRAGPHHRRHERRQRPAVPALQGHAL